MFGVSEDTFLRCTDVVMDALVGNLHQIIRWPKPSEFEEIASEFDKVGRFFPNVIGAIDGLHLEIELTEERRFEPSFINYKQFHSVHLQVRLILINYLSHMETENNEILNVNKSFINNLVYVNFVKEVRLN